MSLVVGVLSVSLALFPSAQGNPGAPALAKPAVQLRVGDKAPPIEVEAFLRGEPFEAFEAGRVYVLEFWATWCGPCIGAMPHLSELQAQYKARVTVLGVDVWEDKEHGPGGSLDKVRAFVEKKGAGLAYAVAYDGDGGSMSVNWMKAAGLRSIPATFVVDGTGTLVWIGHPDALDLVLTEVLAGTWDLAAGPARLAAARQAVAAAWGKYVEGFEAGEKAWKDVLARYPTYAPRFEDRRYAEMLAAGHEAQAYALGRTMLAAAKAKGDPLALMDIVIPMMDPQRPPKTLDRELALAVAEALQALADPSDPGPHTSLVQIHLMLGNLDEARKHKEQAIELAPAEVKARVREWLERLEQEATQKK